MTIEGGALGLLAYYIQPMFDDIFIAGDTSSLMPISLAIFAIFLARGLGAFGQRSLTIRIGLKVITNLQKDLLKHLMTLDSGFYNHHSPGALIERVRGDSQALQGFAANALMTLGRDTVSLISLLSVAIYVDWKWTLVAFIGVPVLVFPIFLIQQLIRRKTRFARHTSADISTRLDEIFHGIKAIKLNNTQSHESKRFEKGVNTYLKAQSQSEYGKAALPALIDVVAGFGFVGVMILGGQDIMNGDKSVGEFMSFFTALALIFDPIRRLTNIGGAVQAALASMERIFFLFDQKAEIVNLPKATAPKNPKGDIQFREVEFAYGDKTVLNKLSFTAPAGKTTALVGPSGAGKTTVFNLLTRLEEPQQGCIELGDENISDIHMDALREQISVVSQESALFDETIAQNIGFGRLTASEDEISLAAKTALVTEFADLLPEKLDALAGPRGSKLSGGQRQRVVIARALLRDAPVLLLDEATSALDTNTEQLIQAALEQASKGRTTIVIAHRLSTIRDADIIHVMQDGQVVESGTHDQLMEKAGAYMELHKDFVE